jgi:hypothetical protein
MPGHDEVKIGTARASQPSSSEPIMPARKRAAAPPRIKRTPPPREADPFAKKTGRRRNYFTGEFLAEAQRRVEQTSQSTTAIAGNFGMHHSVLSNLIERQGWVRPESSGRRRGLSPVMRLAATVDEMATAPHPNPLPSERASTPVFDGLCGEREHTALVASADASDTSAIDRLEAAVLKELSVVEKMRASLRSEPLRPMDAERTARTLSVLTETLAKLRRLRLGAQPQSGSIDDDDMPADIDAFRLDLARRIEAFVASRSDDHDAGRDAGPAALDEVR